VNHYGDDTDSPAWIQETTDPAGEFTRYITGLDGGVAATINKAGQVRLQLGNLHGDIALDLDLSGTAADQVFNADEYGNPTTTPARYGWLGTHQRSTETPNEAILMGVRLYQPNTGRFLQVDPIMGGNANTYIYPTDPLTDQDISGAMSRRVGNIRLREVIRRLMSNAFNQVERINSCRLFCGNKDKNKRLVWAAYEVAKAQSFTYKATATHDEELNFTWMINFKQRLADYNAALTGWAVGSLAVYKRWKFTNIMEYSAILFGVVLRNYGSEW
jgi:RHS repeat-associated protein